MQKAILLHASLSPGHAPEWSEPLLHGLPYGRRLQLEGADPATRGASLAGLALALAGASRLADPPPQASDLLLADGQKPRFASGPFFSVSHTGDRVACAVACDVDLGLDLETAPATADRSAQRNLLRWTATEAVLKAAGLGLRRMADVRFGESMLEAWLDGRRYVLRELLLAPHTLGHVAAVEPVDPVIAAVALDGPDVSAAVQRALGLASQR